MANIKEAPYGCTETYTVKFWYTNKDGFRQQGEEDFYCNSKSAHEDVEKYFYKFCKSTQYIKPEVISVVYN